MRSQKVEILGAAFTKAAPNVRVAICGEVSSGKSTVLNLLLRAQILPDNIGRARRPVVMAAYRPEPGAEVEHLDGQTTIAETTGDADLFRDAALVRLWSDRDHLAGLEIIEVPLTKAEDLTAEQIDLIRSSDVMVWVTIASQAWRLTEKTIIELLGDARPARSILAVTRADKLRNDRDRQRLKARLLRETEGYFDACIFVSGARQKIGKSASCDRTWTETGGAEIASALSVFAEQIREARSRDEANIPDAKPDADAVVDLAAFRLAAERASLVAGDVSEGIGSTAIEEADLTPVELAAEPEPAPIVETAEPAQDSVRTIPPDTMETLRETVRDLRGVVVAVLQPHAPAQDGNVMYGDPARAREVGIFCRRTLENLAQSFGQPDETAGPTAFHLATNDHRFLFQDIPQVGLLCLMADASEMNQGIAQSALSRLCRILETAA